MTHHEKPADDATREALAILKNPTATLYNTEGHISIYGVDGTTSVNVWHCPLLRKQGCTELHTHCFHACSTILAGQLVNTQFTEDEHGDDVDLVKMVPGKWQREAELTMRVSGQKATYGRGESYCIPYAELHLAITPALAITLFRRSDVHCGEAILMQSGGRLGYGGANWSPGPELVSLLYPINLATRAVLRDDLASHAELEELLANASAAVDADLTPMVVE